MATLSPFLFVDWTCPSPYASRTVLETALGGTEATVTRIADALDARVMQHNRKEAEGRYVPPASDKNVQHVVLLRDPRCMREMRERFPAAQLYLWMHDLVRPGSKRGRRVAACARTLSELAVRVICVSQFQRNGMVATLREAGYPNVDVQTIYNPIDDALRPDGSEIDSNKLVFFSSPNKGLSYTLDAFQALRSQMPELRLYVGNPGYKKLRRSNFDGVHWLGGLPHAHILSEARTALCVFYPNFVLPETFGLVLAEANAVGTPVITHDCGAASEVLADSRQVLPILTQQRTHERLSRWLPSPARQMLYRWSAKRSTFAPYVERVQAWKCGARPRTTADARFKLSKIANEWRTLFDGAPAHSASDSSSKASSTPSAAGSSSAASLSSSDSSAARALRDRGDFGR